MVPRIVLDPRQTGRASAPRHALAPLRSARARLCRRPPRSGLPEFPAPPHSAFIIQHSALPPPPPAMKRLALLLPLLALAAGYAKVLDARRGFW